MKIKNGIPSMTDNIPFEIYKNQLVSIMQQERHQEPLSSQELHSQ